MSIKRTDHKVTMPDVVPTCTWEDVERFQCVLLSEQIRAKMGAELIEKYGTETTERLLDYKNIQETVFLLNNAPYIPKSEMYKRPDGKLLRLNRLY